jgi:hypothetical protein
MFIRKASLSWWPGEGYVARFRNTDGREHGGTFDRLVRKLGSTRVRLQFTISWSRVATVFKADWGPKGHA